MGAEPAIGLFSVRSEQAVNSIKLNNNMAILIVIAIKQWK
jgi:hypothetical protein